MTTLKIDDYIKENNIQNPTRFKEIMGYVDKLVDDQETDMNDLPSAKRDNNIYGVEPQYAVGGWNYDEDEFYMYQLQMTYDKIENDGLLNCVGIGEEEEATYQELVLGWLQKLIDEVS